MGPGPGPTHYDLLGVRPTASAAEIRTAYHDLVARYHPDRHDGNALADLATEKLAALNAAYEVLSDPSRRAAYDSELAQGGTAAGGPAGGRAAQARLVRTLLVIGALLLLLRLGPLLARALWNLLRMLWESAALLRGTPLFALLFLAALAGAVLLILRRGTARRRNGK